MTIGRVIIAVAALSLIAASCGDDEPDVADTSTTVEASPEQGAPPEMVDEGRTLDAPVAAITVDGDPSDWDGVQGIDMTLEAISDEDFPSADATLKVAHDDENVFVLVQVDDDYNWDPEDAHLSSSSAVQWAIDADAAEHMGAEDDDRETSLGMVDIWHWELECGSGEQSGGAVSGPGEGEDPGNDEACNFDDEWSTVPEEREDDNGPDAENSLLGVWSHSDETADADGTWTFEMQRPLQSGDAQDVQLAVGSSARVALAYWDADTGPDGWEDEFHVQSANQGWIVVTLV